jgi:hypothetical protein
LAFARKADIMVVMKDMDSTMNYIDSLAIINRKRHNLSGAFL